MQVANTLNNTIRILFNPTIEAFRLFDFLVVKSNNDNYLAQITEIYDDKFDSSQNVAKLKLFYKISKDNEVIPYDNFTPNKECEIVKIKQQEIETFINQNKETFKFATNTRSTLPFNIQYDFFDNNAVVLADKIENYCSISLSLAKELSKQHSTIIIDSTGVVDYEDATKLTTTKNFRLPLNCDTIDFVFSLCLPDASLEFQALADDIINEIKKFIKKQENQSIPFSSFISVLLQQYKATPFSELKLLLSRIKKYQLDEIFVKGKKDVDSLDKIIEENKLIVIDLSPLNSLWQKAFLEYIVNNISKEIYMLTRINEENCDIDFVNKIYNQKNNIHFIPNVSYNYKKLPSVVQYCKNYIMLPSIYQRSDFLNANFALSNLIQDECIIFGENTDNFLFLVNAYELKAEEKAKNYRKIELSLSDEHRPSVDEILGEKGDYFENEENKKSKTDEEKSHDDFLMEQLAELSEDTEIEDDSDKETFEEIINPKMSHPILKEDTEPDDFQEITNAKESTKTPAKEETKEPTKIEINEENDLIFPEENKNIEQKIEEKIKKEAEVKIEEKARENIAPQKLPSEDSVETTSKEIAEETIEEIVQEPIEEVAEEIVEKSIETKEAIIEFEEETIAQTSVLEEKITEEETISITQEETLLIEEEDVFDFKDSDNKKANEDKKEEIVEMYDESPITENELDFFELAKETSAQAKDRSIIQKNDSKEEMDLSEIANNSIDDNFKEIINSKQKNSSQSLKIDDETELNLDSLNEQTKKENLPIFKEEKPKTTQRNFSTGDKVIHKSYGRGTVVNIIDSENTSFLQIEFEKSGKKLLDPKIANITLEQ